MYFAFGNRNKHFKVICIFNTVWVQAEKMNYQTKTLLLLEASAQFDTP